MGSGWGVHVGRGHVWGEIVQGGSTAAKPCYGTPPTKAAATLSKASRFTLPAGRAADDTPPPADAGDTAGGAVGGGGVAGVPRADWPQGPELGLDGVSLVKGGVLLPELAQDFENLRASDSLLFPPCHGSTFVNHISGGETIQPPPKVSKTIQKSKYLAIFCAT